MNRNATFIWIAAVCVAGCLCWAVVQQNQHSTALRSLAQESAMRVELQSRVDLLEKQMKDAATKADAIPDAVVVGKGKDKVVISSSMIAFIRDNQMPACLQVTDDGASLSIGNGDGKASVTIGPAHLISPDGTQTTTAPGGIVMFQPDGKVAMRLPSPR